MSFILHPWHLLFAILSGCVHRRQQQIIEFYRSQLESMLEVQGKKRILKDEDVKSVRLPPRSPDPECD